VTGQGISQIVLYSIVLVALGYPLGLYMARVYNSEKFLAGGWFGWLRALERGFYGLVRTKAKKEQDWKSYGTTVLAFSVLFMAVLYAIQRLQGHLFLNPDHMKAVPAHLSLNTAASFITNTNWQFYGGEYTMSYFTQMAGLRSGWRWSPRWCAGSRGARRARSGTSGSTSTARLSTSCCRLQ
jgi:K+-transporting ATPase ATPase A chain